MYIFFLFSFRLVPIGFFPATKALLCCRQCIIILYCVMMLRYFVHKLSIEYRVYGICNVFYLNIYTTMWTIEFILFVRINIIMWWLWFLIVLTCQCCRWFLVNAQIVAACVFYACKYGQMKAYRYAVYTLYIVGLLKK